jgi:hypothetical protein
MDESIAGEAVSDIFALCLRSFPFFAGGDVEDQDCSLSLRNAHQVMRNYGITS